MQRVGVTHPGSALGYEGRRLLILEPHISLLPHPTDPPTPGLGKLLPHLLKLTIVAWLQHQEPGHGFSLHLPILVPFQSVRETGKLRLTCLPQGLSVVAGI